MMDPEKVSKWVKQLGVKNIKAVEKEIKKNQIDGYVLYCLKSGEDLRESCDLPADTAQVIFDAIQSLKADGNVKEYRGIKFVQDDPEDIVKSPFVEVCEKAPQTYYVTLEASLTAANFKKVERMLKYSRETAMHLRRQGKLEKLNISQADAMALTIYTYDHGPGGFEDNPYRIMNKSLGERNTQKVLLLKGYVLRLLSALRKLPSYTETSKLYRAVANVTEKSKCVGSVLSWPAFTSTSTDKEPVIYFIKNFPAKGPKYIFEITGCFNKAHNIREFSFHPDEDGK